MVGAERFELSRLAALRLKRSVSHRFTKPPWRYTIRNYKTYTDEDIIRLSKETKSIRALLEALGLRPAGGNYANIKRNLQRLGVDTPHWTGQAWNKGQQLKDWSKYTKTAQLKKHLIKARGYSCEECGIKKWQGQTIVLELDHIDGDRTHNVPENLRLLCPNCHSLTPTWRNRKR